MKDTKYTIIDFGLEFHKKNGRYPRIFLSGAITGRMDSYKVVFNNAEKLFKKLGMYDIYNPATIPETTSWNTAMQITLKELKEKADVVYVLVDWEESTGTKKEIEVAEELNIPIFYEEKETDIFFQNFVDNVKRIEETADILTIYYGVKALEVRDEKINNLRLETTTEILLTLQELWHGIDVKERAEKVNKLTSEMKDKLQDYLTKDILLNQGKKSKNTLLN